MKAQTLLHSFAPSALSTLARLLKELKFSNSAAIMYSRLCEHGYVDQNILLYAKLNKMVRYYPRGEKKLLFLHHLTSQISQYNSLMVTRRRRRRAGLSISGHRSADGDAELPDFPQLSPSRFRRPRQRRPRVQRHYRCLYLFVFRSGYQRYGPNHCTDSVARIT